VKPGVDAEDWVPAQILFWSRDALPVVKELVGDEALAKDMKWSPAKLYNSKGERLYSELYSGNWWWETQVRSAANDTLKD